LEVGLELDAEPGAVAKLLGTRAKTGKPVSEKRRVAGVHEPFTGCDHLSDKKEPTAIMVQTVR
jgi:hypothetical protein